MAKSNLDIFLKLHGQRKFSKELAASGVELEAMGLKGAAAMTRFAASERKLKNFGRSWTRNVTLPTVVGAGLAVKAAVDWESAFTGVKKTVNATEAQYASMERGIRQMSLHIPVAANELAGIAEAAGQLGIKRAAILSFTRTIADLGVSTNLAGDEAATTLARFGNITQMPQSQFRRLGSTIVALGNAGASTESDIAAMGLRIAAAGSYVGMSEPQILGYANALSSVGIEAEAGGTAISAVFKTINSAVASGGAKLAAFAEVSGESSTSFAKHWKQDAASASVAWIEGLSRLKKEGADVPAVLSALSPKLRGERIQDTLIRATSAGDLLRESLELGSKAWKNNSALTEEARKRYKTVASQFQKLKNRIVDVGVTLGQKLLPPLIHFVNIAGPMVGSIAERFAALPGPIKASVLGLLVLTGPIASGLGYFAGGLGRALILTRKLAEATTVFKATLSKNVMTEQSGFRGAFGAASQKMGMSGGLQAAKGFGIVLGPALAGLGIVNIVSSATEHDWKEVGFQAGGAAVGGIVAVMTGNPELAPLGMGIGALAGGFLGGLFSSSKKLSPLQERVARTTGLVTAQFEHLKDAGHGLVASEGRVKRSRVRMKTATSAMKVAQGHYNAVLQEYGPRSRATLRSETKLTLKVRAHRREVEKLKHANRLSGLSLSTYKTVAERTEVVLRRQIKALKQQTDHLGRSYEKQKQLNPQSKKTGDLAKAFQKTVTQLGQAEQKQAQLRQSALQKGGPPLLRFLKNAENESLAFGRSLKHVTDEIRNMSKASQDLPFAGTTGEGGFWTINPQGEVEKVNAGGDPIRHHPAHPKHPGKGGNRQGRRGTTQALPRPRQVKAGSLSNVVEIHVVNQNTLTLDGKPIAESTSRESRRAANRK